MEYYIILYYIILYYIYIIYIILYNYKTHIFQPFVVGACAYTGACSSADAPAEDGRWGDPWMIHGSGDQYLNGRAKFMKELSWWT